MTLLWPDVPERQGRDSLRQVLLALRKAVGERTLRTEGDFVSLATDEIHVDVAELEALAGERAIKALAQVRGLYVGDLLGGIGGSDEAFEEWLVRERERVRTVALRCFDTLADLQTARAPDDAAETLRHLLALDPVRETAHRALMRLYAATGHPDAALKQYEACVTTLSRELRTQPGPETRRLYQEIVSARGPAKRAGSVQAATRVEASPLVGRDAERVALIELLERTQHGRGALAVVVGDAGIGKTRLVSEIVGQARAGGAAIVYGRCRDAEQMLPLQPWSDALRDTLAITGEPPELAAGVRAELAGFLGHNGAANRPTSTVRHVPRLFGAILDLLARLAAKQPVVIVLEDAHWSDDLSVQLLAYVARRIAHSPVLMLTTLRAGTLVEHPTLDGALTSLADEAHFSRIDLKPLTREEIRALVRAVGAETAPVASPLPVAEQIWRLSQGNPFVALEGVRVVQQDVTLSTQAGIPMPARVRELISSRLRRCSGPARQMATLAAVIGRPFEFSLLAEAAGVATAETAGAVEELARRNVLGSVGSQLDFTHDTLREVTYAEILPPVRKALHSAVARAIEVTTPDSLARPWAALAIHYRESESWERAVDAFQRAGKEALLRGGHREGTRCIEQALRALEKLPADGPHAVRAIDLRFDLHHALVLRGALPEVLDVLREAEALAGQLGDRARLAHAQSALALGLVMNGRNRAAAEVGERAVRATEEVGDRDGRATALYALTVAYFWLGEYRKVIEFAARRGRTETNRPARKVSMGMIPSVGTRRYMARSLAELGEFAEALDVARASVADAEAAGHHFSLVGAYYDLGWVLLRRGDVEEAERVFAQGLAVATEAEFAHFVIYNTGGRGLALARGGRAAEGLPLVEEAERRLAEEGLKMGKPQWLLWLGEALWRAGRLAEARAQTERALSLARAESERGVEGWALRQLAEIDAGEGADAVQCFREAIAIAVERGMRPLEAECRLGLARLHEQRGRATDAATERAAATTLFTAMDLTASA